MLMLVSIPAVLVATVFTDVCVALAVLCAVAIDDVKCVAKLASLPRAVLSPLMYLILVEQFLQDY